MDDVRCTCGKGWNCGSLSRGGHPANTIFVAIRVICKLAWIVGGGPEGVGPQGTTLMPIGSVWYRFCGWSWLTIRDMRQNRPINESSICLPHKQIPNKQGANSVMGWRMAETTVQHKFQWPSHSTNQTQDSATDIQWVPQLLERLEFSPLNPIVNKSYKIEA